MGSHQVILLSVRDRYSSELPVVLIQSAMYLAIMVVTRLARPSLTKLCYNRKPEKNAGLLYATVKLASLWSIVVAYTVPFFLIPQTVHPVIGWSLYLLGSSALASIVINVFVLPALAALTPWIGIFGSLLVMACPWYSDGVVRALAVAAYACFCAPFLWASLTKMMASLNLLVEREGFLRLGESTQPSEFNKLY